MKKSFTQQGLMAVAVVLLLFSGGLRAALGGTYTINQGAAASATNYLSLSAAIADLTSGVRTDGGPANGPGVSGPVTLRIVSGSGPYTEQVTIGAIAGASPTNFIRITGSSSRELIQFSGTTTADRHVIKLNGARHIILDSLSVTNTDLVYGYGVHLTNGADSNAVTNCIVNVDPTATGSNFAGITISGSTVTSSGDWGDDNLIQGNTVTGGYYGITMRGTGTTTYAQRNKIIGNTISDAYYYGIYTYYQNLSEVGQNRIYMRSTASTSNSGIYLYYSDAFKCNLNIIQGFGSYGIYSYYGNNQGGAPVSRASIINNMVGGSCIGTSPYGIFCSTNSRNIDIWHNSVSIDNGNGRALYMTSGSGNDVRNNSFAVYGSTTGYAMYISSTTYVTTVNYNNYYAPGSSNFIYLGVAYSTATYVGGGGFNANSKDGAPGYVNTANDLHVSSAIQLRDAGDATLGITTDIDGDVRPLAPTAGYDIGADEYTPALNDAGVTAHTTQVVPVAPGLQNVDVIIKNFGINTLTSATINWTVDGVPQTPAAWTGSLAQGVSASAYTVGSYNFVQGTYALKFWTSAPNGTSDDYPSNDTLEVTVCVGLSGTYSIGGVSPDFNNMTEAVNALICGGVLGPVNFNVASGSGPYMEQISIPAITGASSVNTIRFNGNLETLTYSATTTSDRYVIRLDGARHITIDSFTVVNGGTTYGFGIQLTNGADSNTVINSVVTVDASSTSTNFAGITISANTVTTNGDHGEDNLIQNNTISGGYYGIAMRGVSTSVKSMRNKLIGNQINDSYYYGIYSYYQDLTDVESNTISIRTSGSTSAYGIYLYYTDQFSCEGNSVQNSGAYGIYSAYGNYQGGSGVTRASIYNNMVGGGFRGTSPYGIYLSTSCTNIDVFHNSVSIDNGNGRALYITSGSGNDIRNNSFAVFGSTTGYAAYISNTTYVSNVNYNNYWADGSSNFIYIGVAYSTATYVGGGGYNLNAINADPLYQSNAGNLHVVLGPLNDAGDNTAGVTTDFDGDARPLAPATTVDIGADEFNPLQFDALLFEILNVWDGICPDSNQAVSVVINNQGTDPLTSVPVTVNFTGTVTGSISATYTGSISSLASDTFLVGYINTHPGGIINFTAFSTLGTDQKNENDTARKTVDVTVLAALPVATGATGCDGDSLMLTVVVDGAAHYWYDSLSGGNLVSTADTFLTPALTASTNYYVESRVFTSDNLTTMFATNNSAGGNMFDLYAMNEITIDSFDVSISGNNERVEVYYKVGSYIGFENNASAWTLLGTDSIVTAAGADNPTRVHIGGLTIPAGQTYALYVTAVYGSMHYTNGANTYSDSNIMLTLGNGNAYPFTSNFTPRSWNGTIYYSKASCPTSRVPVTATVHPYPLSVLPMDTAGCGSVMLDAGNAGMTYSWSTGDVSQMITMTVTDTVTVDITNMGMCTLTDTVAVMVYPDAVVDLGADTVLCDGSALMLDAGTAVSWNWSTGAMTQTEVVSAAGSYSVSIIDSNGCAAADTIDISTLNTPVASFTVDTSLCPVINFTDLTTGGGIATWNWTFGDGNASATQNPSNDYTAAGNGVYSVTLITGNACGSDTATVNLTISCLTGMEEQLAAGIAVYPNPASDVIHIDMAKVLNSSVSIKLFNLYGQVVQSITEAGASGSVSTSVDVSNLPKGTYVLSIINGEHEVRYKVMVQ